MGTSLINDDPGFRPYIEGTRIDVQHVVEYHKIFGWEPSQIVEAFRLTLAQVHAALAYYYEHQQEIDESLAADRAANHDLPNILNYHEAMLMLVMTPQEIAEQYPISVDAVYQAIRRERLPARQSGKTWLILRRDAQRLWGHKRTA